MNLRTLKNMISGLTKKPKKKSRRMDIIPLYEGDTPKFHKRRKKAVFEMLRRFSIPFSKNSIIIYCVIIGLIALGSILLLITGPFFDIKDIYITRQNTNVNIELAYRAVDNIRGKKSFLIDTQYIDTAIGKNQESIKSISTSLTFPDRVNINIEAYENVFQTHISDKPYAILENGSVIPLVGVSSVPYIVVYQGAASLSNIPDYKKIFSSTAIEAINFLKNSLVENIIELKISALHYYVAERELIVELESGGDIIFDLTRNLPAQIEKIAIFHDESGEITQKSLIYIDARIENRLFYCDTTTEYLCRINMKDIYGTRKKPPVTEVIDTEESTSHLLGESL